MFVVAPVLLLLRIAADYFNGVVVCPLPSRLLCDPPKKPMLIWAVKAERTVIYCFGDRSFTLPLFLLLQRPAASYSGCV
jgi:hypothetical protein